MKHKICILLLTLIFVAFGCINPDETLLKSVMKNDIAGVKKAIDKGANVNLRIKKGEYKGFTMLMWASRKGKTEIVKLLLKAGADVRLKTPLNKKNMLVRFNGWTALRLASSDHIEIVKLLLKAGADVNTEDATGGTPLMAAIGGNKTKIAKILLKAGADINANYGEPLKIASSFSGNVELVRFLIKNGANAKKIWCSGFNRSCKI